MRRLVERRPSPAMVVALIALFVALGGTGYAAVALPKNSVGSAQLKKGAVTPPKVSKKTVALFKGQRGPQGVPGPQGPQGPKGDPGTVDTSNVFTKAESDARFVALANSRPYAWGQVRADGSLRPVSARVLAVTRPQTGLYCVQLSGSPDQSQLEGASVTLAGTTAQALFPHITNGQGSDCSNVSGAVLSIRFYTSIGQLADARFSFVVP